MIVRRLLPLCVLAALVSGCNDSATARDTADIPTAPGAVADLQSSTCRAYDANLSAVRSALQRAPNDPALVERETAFRAIIADACN